MVPAEEPEDEETAKAPTPTPKSKKSRKAVVPAEEPEDEETANPKPASKSKQDKGKPSPSKSIETPPKVRLSTKSKPTKRRKLAKEEDVAVDSDAERMARSASNAR